MTDRHQGYIVILDKNLREHDSATVMAAMRLIRGVISVEPVVADGTDLIARAREFERWRAAMSLIVQFGPDAVTNPRDRQE